MVVANSGDASAEAMTRRMEGAELWGTAFQQAGGQGWDPAWGRGADGSPGAGQLGRLGSDFTTRPGEPLGHLSGGSPRITALQTYLSLESDRALAVPEPAPPSHPAQSVDPRDPQTSCFS